MPCRRTTADNINQSISKPSKRRPKKFGLSGGLARASKIFHPQDATVRRRRRRTEMKLLRLFLRTGERVRIHNEFN